MSDCVTLWIGDRLGAVERACVRSVLRQGHRLALYCYSRPEGVPDGIEMRDAFKVLPQSAIFRHRSGSFAPFSDWFRYALQRQGLGTWVDTDLYLLRPLDLDQPCLFGEQEPGVLNNAVLRLPPDSPLLPDLLRPFEQRTTPSWLPLPAYIRSRLRELVVGSADLASLPWGSTGPHALTAVARRHDAMAEAQPPEVFYPVPWQKADWIIDPALSVEQIVTGRTVAIHLWNERIKTLKTRSAPPGSFLHRLQEEGR